MWCSLVLLAGPLAKGPLLPPGCDASLSNAVQLVEQALEKSDFKEAQKRCAWLPKRQFAILWNDQGVPASDRAAFAGARDRAIAAWVKAVPSLKIAVARTGSVEVSFVNRLETSKGDLTVPGALHKVSLDRARKVFSRIALFRGADLQKTTSLDVQNEVGYAIGCYLGLSKSPIYTQIMGRTDQPNTIAARVTADEATWANDCLTVSEFLRSAAAAKKRVARSYPVAEIQPIEPLSTDTVQGDKPIYTLAISNSGNSPLRYRLASTCGCLSMVRNGTVEPGGTKRIPIELDTTEFRGDLTKVLYVYTNDGNVGTLEIPMRSRITPAYRMLCPQGTAFILGKVGVTFDVFLSLAEKAGIRPIRAEVDGMEAKVEMSPWSGELADPELNEDPKTRKGYRLRVSVPDQPIVGRRPGTLTVTTDNLAFPFLRFNFSVQKGIVALPISVYFGQAKPGSEAFVTLSRPGQPFRVVSIQPEADFIEAEIVSGVLGETQRIVVRIKPGAPKGPFRTLLRVATDDPDQPEVLVGVGGAVK